METTHRKMPIKFRFYSIISVILFLLFFARQIIQYSKWHEHIFG